MTGQVPHVEPFLDGARLVLAALRYGAGVKGKTVDAMRFGVPVVCTPVGAEGIGIKPGRDAIVAEDAPTLAKGVLELLNDPERCAALSVAGASLVRKRFSRASARKTVGRVFATLRCGICGSGNLIEPPPDGNYPNLSCAETVFALGRAEALGARYQSIWREMVKGRWPSWPGGNPRSAVHEFGFVGGVSDTLRGQPWYSMSEYFPGVPVGTSGPAA